VRLLFDENISPALVHQLADLYPDSLHVRDVGLQSADDEAVWSYALENDLIIVSKDNDFHQRSFLYGHPPKVVWLRLGNCSTEHIEARLRARHTTLLAFFDDREGSFLVLG